MAGSQSIGTFARLALAGDVMLGRLFNQILPSGSSSTLALRYPHLASLTVSPRSIWGDLLPLLTSCCLRIANLECSLADADPANNAYLHRVASENIPAALEGILDACCLANNHALDMGVLGLKKTLVGLNRSKIKWVGIGKDCDQARRPVILESKNGLRVGLLAYADHLVEWAAARGKPGINYFDIAGFTTGESGNLNRRAVTDVVSIREVVNQIRDQVDIVVFSVHWGDNFCWRPPEVFRQFARELVTNCCVDVVYGHSAHHVQGVEVVQGGLILYGCGDFLDDYDLYDKFCRQRDGEEGEEDNDSDDSDAKSENDPDSDTDTNEENSEDDNDADVSDTSSSSSISPRFDYTQMRLYRSDLSFLYILHCFPPSPDFPKHRVARLEMVPTRIRHLTVNQAAGKDREWVMSKMKELCEEMGTKTEERDGRLFVDVIRG